MKNVMEEDRTKHSILPLSRFGLMQITRQRVRPEMSINTREKCPTCDGTGEISPSIILVDRIQNTLADLIEKNKIKHLTLRLHPYVAAYIQKGWLNTISRRWSKEFKCKLKVVPVSSYDFLEFRFFSHEGAEIFY